MGGSSKLFKTLAHRAKAFKPSRKQRPCKEKYPSNARQYEQQRGDRHGCLCGLGKRNRDAVVDSQNMDMVAGTGMLPVGFVDSPCSLPSRFADTSDIKIACAEQDMCIDDVDGLAEATELKHTINVKDTSVKHVSESSSATVVIEPVVQEENMTADVQDAMAEEDSHAFRSIVKVQALARGRIVRNQAAMTLRCVRAVVRIQAVTRGNHVRRSELGQLVQRHLQQRKAAVDNLFNEQQSSNSMGHLVQQATRRSVFLEQILKRLPNYSSFCAKSSPYEIHWIWPWLDRWTATRPWEKLGRRERSASVQVMVTESTEENVQIDEKADTYPDITGKDDIPSFDQRSIPNDRNPPPAVSESRISTLSITGEGEVVPTDVQSEGNGPRQSDIMEESILCIDTVPPSLDEVISPKAASHSSNGIASPAAVLEEHDPSVASGEDLLPAATALLLQSPLPLALSSQSLSELPSFSPLPSSSSLQTSSFMTCEISEHMEKFPNLIQTPSPTVEASVIANNDPLVGDLRMLATTDKLNMKVAADVLEENAGHVCSLSSSLVIPEPLLPVSLTIEQTCPSLQEHIPSTLNPHWPASNDVPEDAHGEFMPTVTRKIAGDADGVSDKSRVQNGGETVIGDEPPLSESGTNATEANAQLTSNAIAQVQAHCDTIQSTKPSSMTSATESNALSTTNDIVQVDADCDIIQSTKPSSMLRISRSTHGMKNEQGAIVSPSLPSYMATTQASKAKIRTQVSPKSKSDLPKQKADSPVLAPARRRHTYSGPEGKCSSTPYL